MAEAFLDSYVVHLTTGADLDIARITFRIYQDRGIDDAEDYELKLRATVDQLGTLPHTGNVITDRHGTRRYTPNHDAVYNIWFVTDDEARTVSVRCIIGGGNAPSIDRFFD